MADKPKTLDEILAHREQWLKGERQDLNAYAEIILSPPAHIPPQAKNRDFSRLLANEAAYNERLEKISNAIRNGFQNVGMDLRNVERWQDVAEWLAATDEWYAKPNITQDGTTPERTFYTSRGLFLYGPPGTGKTFVAKNIERQWLGTTLYDVREMERDFITTGSTIFWHDYAGLRDPTNIAIIDDVGIEQGAQSYGQKFDVGAILCIRHDLWRGSGTPTVITSNLDGLDGVAERYGPPTASRLGEMCTPVYFEGSDNRLGWLDT